MANRTIKVTVEHTVPERRTIVLPVRMGEVIYPAPEHVIAALTKKLDGSGRS